MSALSPALTALDGHLWTIGRRLGSSLSAPRLSGAAPWSTRFEDPVKGDIRLSGWLSEIPGAGALAVLVHGLGGSSASPYMLTAAAALMRAGYSCLRLNLRGADNRGNDFYHAGLTADLAAAVASADLAAYRRLVVLGFSLGGHLALRFATEEHDPRVRAVAAVCPPLDLDACVRAIDRPAAWPYRVFVLRHLKENYRALALNGDVPTPVSRLEGVRRLRTWDRLTVVRRFGFTDSEDYYARMSVGPQLGRHRSPPALVVATVCDPMIPAESLRPHLQTAAGPLTVRWVRRGGHVGFPSALDLGFGGELGVAPQVAAWFGQIDG